MSGIPKYLGILCILMSNYANAGQYLPAASTPIENQFIVVLKSTSDTPHAREETLKNLAKKHLAQVNKVYSKSLNGGVMRLSEDKAKELANDPLVDYVEQDSVVKLIEPLAAGTQIMEPSSSWGLDRIDQRNLPLNGFYSYYRTGAVVKAYVIDTGIRVTHSEFGGRASIGFDAVGDGQNGNDCNGHGTHVAGAIGGLNYGVAKNVSLIAVRVLDCSASGSTTSVIAGIDYVTKTHQVGQPAVVNMSLSTGVSKALDAAVNNSIADGITYVVAAGNTNSDACKASPSRVANAITVGATTDLDYRAAYSNYGSCLDIFAPGTSITSAWSNSDLATNTMNGTSMATAFVAGAAALYLEINPTATSAIVESTLKSNATVGKLNGMDRKTVNLLLYSLF